MSASKQARPRINNHETLGLLANGSSGSWDIAIDETTSGVDRWFIQIEGPTLSFYFEIASPNTVEKMVQFFEDGPKRVHNKTTKRNCSLPIGKEGSVTLVRDDEHADRFYVVVGAEDRPVVRFALVGADLTNVISALRQVTEDLEDS